MKRNYIQISMLIQGPKQPGIDINMYLGLLKEELATLWETPANTYDAVAQDYFPLRAALITTVQDYLGYGYVAGQVNHGHYHVSSAWTIQRITNYKEILGLRKLCTRVIEGG